MDADGNVDDFGFGSPFSIANERARNAKKRWKNQQPESAPVAKKAKSEPSLTGLTPDDFVERDEHGKMLCSDCKKFTVDCVEDGTYSAYTCTECGLVSTMQVLEQGYHVSDNFDKEQIAGKMHTDWLKEFSAVKKEKDTNRKLWKVRREIRTKGKENATADVIEEEMRLAAEYRQQYTMTRKENLHMDEAIQKILEHIGIQANNSIKLRSNQLAGLFIAKHPVTDVSRYILASVCVARAGLENNFGLRWWDVQCFLQEHKAIPREDGAIEFKSNGTLKKKAHKESRIFSKWRGTLRRTLDLPKIDRIKEFQAYVNSFVERAVISKQPVSNPERIRMALLVKWIGDAHLNRPKKVEDNERKADADTARVLKCMPHFFRLLSTGCTVTPVLKYLTPASQTRDECIRIWTMAATVIYLVLRMRTRRNGAATQKHMEMITGVKRSSLMGCNQTIQSAIEHAVNDYRLD